MSEHTRSIATLRTAPANFQQVMEALPAHALMWTDGGWSIAAVITHLAINDVNVSQRLRHIVTEYEPALVIYRSDEMIPVLGNPNTTPAEMFGRWQTNRAQICDWLASLQQEDWSRRATHPERGLTTFCNEVELLIAHDAEHLAQVSAVRQAWEARQQWNLSVARSR